MIFVITELNGTFYKELFMAYRMPLAGMVKNSIVTAANAVTLPNAAATNITSLTLDPGTYIIAGSVVFSGSITVVGGQRATISSTSGNIGTVGDNSVVGIFSTLNLAAGDVTLSIPAYMISVPVQTTYYLVAQIGVSLGTAKGYGRLSAALLSSNA
jgi:hypothetical protein